MKLLNVDLILLLNEDNLIPEGGSINILIRVYHPKTPPPTPMIEEIKIITYWVELIAVPEIYVTMLTVITVKKS